MFNKVIVGCDHAGFGLKPLLVQEIREKGLRLEDVGVFSSAESVDYPDSVPPVVKAVLANPEVCGLLICGSGIGMSIAANRFPGIRAALCSDVLTAQLARHHNDANVLVLGAGMIGPRLASACLSAFLGASFEGGRHSVRLEKLARLTNTWE